MKTLGRIVDKAPDRSPLYAISGIAWNGGCQTSLLINWMFGNLFTFLPYSARWTCWHISLARVCKMRNNITWHKWNTFQINVKCCIAVESCMQSLESLSQIAFVLFDLLVNANDSKYWVYMLQNLEINSYYIHICNLDFYRVFNLVSYHS